MFAVDKKDRVRRVNCAAATSAKISRSVNVCHVTNVNAGEVNTQYRLPYLVYSMRLALELKFLCWQLINSARVIM